MQSPIRCDFGDCCWDVFTQPLAVSCRILCPVPQQSPCASLTSCPCAWQGQREAEVPQRKLFQFHVTPVLSKDLFFVDSEPLPCPEKPGDDLAPLTEVPVLGSKPVLWLVQQRPARLFALALELHLEAFWGAGVLHVLFHEPFPTESFVPGHGE